jgi:transmembrane sensor
MITKLENIGKLIGKYLRQELTEEEQKQLNEWINESDDNKTLFEKWTDTQELMRNISDWERLEKSKQDVWQKMDVGADEKKPRSRLLSFQWWKYAAAAVVVLMVGGYYFLQTNKHKPVAKTEQQTVISDKEPGRDGAILKLANGQEIILDNAANGSLAQQGGAAITKEGNLLAYNNSGKNSTEVLYNTLRTPVGRQFQLVLPDGTRAWLNSASSITYPTSFAGSERNVTISGEVYMEVAKDASKPFKVHVTSPDNGMEETVIQVLGTHFNINAYADERPVKATLLEGKVKVLKGNSLAILKPGQQAQVLASEIKVANNVDIDKIIAWKQGYFLFKEDKLSDAMKNIARWYNVDVQFIGSAGDVQISGIIYRNSNLSAFLKVLADIDVDAKIEGRKLIVKAK